MVDFATSVEIVLNSVSSLEKAVEEERKSENCDPEYVLDYEQKIAVCEILQKAFPSISSILVDVSW